MQKLLIVEDNEQFAKSLSASLEDRFTIEKCESALEAIRFLQAKPYDVVLCDYLLRDSSGLDVVTHLKSMRPSPRVVMMTAFAEKSMAILALNAGVSHLLEKPFSVKALREALQPADQEAGAAPTGIQFSPEQNAVIWKGASIRLTPSEYLILSYVVSHKGNWVTREELERMLWEDSPHVSRNTLDTHVYNLRKKIPELADHLSVVRGRGFSFKTLE
nr:Response regulator receiver domain [uncultured organism]